MATRTVLGLLSVTVLAAAIATTTISGNNWSRSTYGTESFCRSVPGDDDWPTTTNWAALNKTVGGRLIATVPIGSVCHNTYKTLDTYDDETCAKLRDHWFYPATHLSNPSSPMAYPFTNNSCNPFHEPDTPCDQGYYDAYTINATSVGDVQAALRFVKEHNVRLLIRNTGHDYLGKSTGAHALAIWTHHMKSTRLIEKYEGPADYEGAAIQLGAGVEVSEAYEFANNHGLVVVGGNCPNVGITGGYTQGGGIGLTSSMYGLAADQVLSWEVVLASGELVTASPTEHSDLYWALRGGGGGTYGVVMSMTVKAHPDNSFSVANMALINDGTNTDQIYSVMATFLQKSLPAMVDAGAWVVFAALPAGFMIMPAMMPNVNPEALDVFMAPTLNKMKTLGLDYTYASAEYPRFLAGYNSMTAAWNVSDANAGGRLIPRELVRDQESTETLVQAIREISSEVPFAGVGFNVAGAVSSPDEVAANPYFRNTLFSATVAAPVNYDNWTANKATQDKMTNQLLPKLEALTPDGGVYLNEADFQDPKFKSNFYGAHYDRLSRIKNLYDPDGIFYAKTAVGSDAWEQKVDGRLCMV